MYTTTELNSTLGAIFMMSVEMAEIINKLGRD